MSTAVALVLLLAVVAYAVFAGADFGAGFWDLTAGGTKRGALYRAKTRRHAQDLQVHPPAGPGMIMPWPHDCST